MMDRELVMMGWAGGEEVLVQARLGQDRLRSAGAEKMGARGMAGGSSVAEEEEAMTFPLGILSAMVGVGVATEGRESGGEWN